MRKLYRAVDHKCLRQDQNIAEDTFRLINGAYFTDNDHVNWVWVTPQTHPNGLELDVKPERFIRSGSLFEADIYPWRQQKWVEDGTVLDGADNHLHFNLEAIFDPDTEPRVRWAGINTLEDIANEKPASIVGVDLTQPPVTKPLRAVLMALAHNQPEVVAMWIQMAKDLIKVAPAEIQPEQLGENDNGSNTGQ